jgi:hypothetical protein
MDAASRKQLKPGVKVKVTQQIAHREKARSVSGEITGSIVSYEQKQTGSWFAHSRDEKLWLDRLTLRKEDGELTSLILDEYSLVEVLPEAAGEAEPEPAAAGT